MTDNDPEKLDARRILSEIERNEAERDNLIAQHRFWWRPTLLAVAVVAAMVASFAGFFSDLYQIAVADRDSVRQTNERLHSEVAAAKEEARKVSMELAAANALHPPPSARQVVTQADLIGAVILTRWGPKLEEANSVLLTDARDGLPGRGGMLGHGSQLGPDKPTTALGLAGGVEWSGNWSLDATTIRITELRPRFNDAVRTEIDLRTWAPGQTVPATRSRGDQSDRGIAEISLFPGRR